MAQSCPCIIVSYENIKSMVITYSDNFAIFLDDSAIDILTGVESGERLLRWRQLYCTRDDFAVPLLFCSVLDLILLSNVVKGKRNDAIVEQDYKWN
jgi:hypothetical protein